MPFTQLFAIPHIVNPQPVYAPAIVKKTDSSRKSQSAPFGQYNHLKKLYLLWVTEAVRKRWEIGREKPSRIMSE
jgi:hypothetical protein